ncbi:MAG: TVP38/TMEM64 family protein [Synechococcales bacterium]|nr:TVP38/TMEM64 family protein [Synechococcales bacterium]
MNFARSRYLTWLKYLGIALTIALIVVLTKQFNLAALLQNTLKQALIWVEDQGNTAPLAFIGVYNLATILLIPGSVLTLGSGILFGPIWGTFYVIIAATLGATIAFWIGRNFARDWVSRQIAKYPKFAAIDRAVAQEGFKIVVLTRLSPLFPFNLLNYAFGITQVSLKDYVFGSIGMIPGSILYVYLGSLLGNLAMIGTQNQTDPQTTTLQWGLKMVGLIATIAVSIYMTRIAKRALDQSLDQ